MSENRNSVLRRGLQVAGAGAVAAVAIGLFSTGAANADTFVPLPDGVKSGPGFTIGQVGSSALVSPSLAANGAGRTVWVTGRAYADVTSTPAGTVGPFNGPRLNGSPQTNSGTNNSSTHGASQLNTGYIVGCQVDITGLQGNLGASLGAPLGLSNMGASAAANGGLTGTISVPLVAGQVKWVQVNYQDITQPGHYSLPYQDVQMEIQNCGGYAQARSYTSVEIIGNNYAKATLYGQPFSIG